MIKVIENIELLKKLQPYLGETEYCLLKDKKTSPYRIGKGHDFKESLGDLKTLTLEEATKFLPAGTNIWYKGGPNKDFAWDLNLNESCIYNLLNNEDVYFEGETQLQAIEKMLEYLIDNNLLPNE